MNIKSTRTYKIFIFLFGLGFGRGKPKTKFKLIIRRTEQTISIFLLLFISLIFYPNFFFPHLITHSGFTVYSTENIPSDIETEIDIIYSKIKKSHYFQENSEFKIFICNSKSLFAFFVPLSSKSFGVTYPFLNRIFIAKVDFVKKQSLSFQEGNRIRTFNGVVTHEVNHVMMNRLLSIYSLLKTPAWITEGYSDYIAGESSFSLENNINLLLEKGVEAEENESFKYFLYRHMIDYLINCKKQSIEDIINQSPNEKKTKQELIDYLKLMVMPTIGDTDFFKR